MSPLEPCGCKGLGPRCPPLSASLSPLHHPCIALASPSLIAPTKPFLSKFPHRWSTPHCCRWADVLFTSPLMPELHVSPSTTCYTDSSQVAIMMRTMLVHVSWGRVKQLTPLGGEAQCVEERLPASAWYNCPFSHVKGRPNAPFSVVASMCRRQDTG